MSKVLIVGAGIGGMACAARLAVKGHSVQVLEQNETYGGKLSEYRNGESRFDLGPNLLHFPAVYRDLFIKTGKPLEESIELVDSDQTFDYRFPDGTSVTLPGLGVGRSAEAIGDALGGSSADEWREFIRRGSDMWSMIRKPFFEEEQSGYSGLAKLLLNPRRFKVLAPFKSLRELVSDYLTDPRLISIVDRYALEAGSDPRKAAAVLATAPYLEQTLGAYQVVGGMSQLSKSLHDRCVELGVEFKFNTKIQNVISSKQIQGLESNSGEIFVADIYVMNFDYRSLNGKDFFNSKSKAGLSTLTFLLETKNIDTFLATNTYYLPEDSDKELNSLFDNRNYQAERTNFTFKITESKTNSPGSALLIQTPVPSLDNGSIDYWLTTENIDRIRSRMFHTLKPSGVALDNAITWEKVLTPLDLQARTNSRAGASYPFSNTGIGSFARLPGNTTSEPNLFVVGDTSHPGGGLAQVGISAELLAERIGRA